MRILAVLMVALGLIGLVWGGVSYVKNRDTAELGPLDVTFTEKNRVEIPPVIAAVLLVGGVALFVADSRRKSG